jgi:exosortase A-associated hydrolase 2
MTVFTVACEPAFVNLAGRRCFVGRWRARGETRGGALLVQPFGDEGHLARRTQRRVAERLAAMGIDTRMLDFSCTGDSEGEFVDASLAQWRAELVALEAQALADTAGPLVLVGGRFGAWLALDRLGKADPRVTGAVLWAPIADGRSQLTPYLRLLALSEARAGEAKPADRARAEWKAGRCVRIAGMDFSSAFVAELDAAVAVPPISGRRVVSLELRDVPGGAPIEPTLGVARVAALWSAAGASFQVETVRERPFWNVPDPLDCDPLVDALVAAVDGAMR